MPRTHTTYPEQQHMVMNHVSWAYYEQTLHEIGDQRLRVTFLDGAIEIMSPLPEHEAAKVAVCGLIDCLTEQVGQPRKSFGSSTFRREEKGAGTEPDACYYFSNIDLVKGMKRYDSSIHPAPDLVIEIDLFSSSIPRELIYARLGVPEIWRYTTSGILVRSLGENLSYIDSPTSRYFSFLPIDGFFGFVGRMIDEEELSVLSNFREWVKTVNKR